MKRQIESKSPKRRRECMQEGCSEKCLLNKMQVNLLQWFSIIIDYVKSDDN